MGIKPLHAQTCLFVKKTALTNQSLTQNFNHSRPTRPPSKDSLVQFQKVSSLCSCYPQLPLAWIWCFLNWDTPMAKDTCYIVGKYNWYIKLMISQRLLFRMRLPLMYWWYSSLHYPFFKYRNQKGLWIFYSVNLNPWKQIYTLLHSRKICEYSGYVWQLKRKYL